MQLEIQKGAKNRWTVSKLRDSLNDYISAREKAEQHANTGISTNRQNASHPSRLSTEALMAGPKAQYHPYEKAKCSGHADSVMETIGMTNVQGTQLLRLESKI